MIYEHIYNFLSSSYEHNPHYLKRYIKLVKSFKARSSQYKIKPKGWHKHHIIPKSFSGQDTEENLVIISPREHFILHWILWKTFDNKKMTVAFFGMCNGFRYFSSRVTSKVYGKLNQEKNEYHSEQHKIYWSNPENRRKQSERKKQYWTDERRKEFGKKNKGKKKSQESIEKRVSSRKNNTLLVGCKCINNGEVNKIVVKNEYSYYIDSGWNKGRLPINKQQCFYCNNYFDPGNYVKSHGDKCKHKK